MLFKTILVRRRSKTQKYKGALFEQLESGWAKVNKDETEQKQDNKKQRHRDQNKEMNSIKTSMS